MKGFGLVSIILMFCCKSYNNAVLGFVVHPFSTSTRSTTSIGNSHRDLKQSNYHMQHNVEVSYFVKRKKHSLGCRASNTVLFSSISDDENIDNDDDSTSNTMVSVWNPSARKVLAVLSAIGAVETGMLSGVKLFGGEDAIGALCSATASGSSGCGNVLSSSYASIGGIPLTAFGFIAYSTVFVLALLPLLNRGKESTQASVGDAGDDTFNRIALLTITTGMGTFSAFLMSLLMFILKEMCPYCILSAIISLTLGVVTWFGGAATEQNRRAAIAGISSVVITTIATIGLFINADSAYAGSSNTGSVSQADTVMMNQAPPPITEKSSARAIALAKDLKALDARMFGAFWCSHCYEQKQTLGQEAMKMITYVECDKEGLNNQRSLCQERKVPGYPTWEIAGTLHPGEQSIEELEEIVKNILDGKQ